MKRATWGVVAFLALAAIGNVLVWLNVPFTRPVWDWLWTNVAPVLDRLTGIR